MIEQILALRQRCAERGEKMFLGIPDEWYDKPGPKYRCKNDHVSTCILKSEAKGCDCCLACLSPVIMTYPQDEDGPWMEPEDRIDQALIQADKDFQERRQAAYDEDQDLWKYVQD